tara:strand:- start:169 stop:408 length:240 start_codon:yes stop_codon:yes gene_type:complete
MRILPESREPSQAGYSCGINTERNQAMLSVIADALRIATYTDRWNAPDHWKIRGPQSQFDAERHEADRMRRHYTDRGIW